LLFSTAPLGAVLKVLLKAHSALSAGGYAGPFFLLWLVLQGQQAPVHHYYHVGCRMSVFLALARGLHCRRATQRTAQKTDRIPGRCPHFLLLVLRKLFELPLPWLIYQPQNPAGFASVCGVHVRALPRGTEKKKKNAHGGGWVLFLGISGPEKHLFVFRFSQDAPPQITQRTSCSCVVCGWTRDPRSFIPNGFL
jgi:hypothetical protein